MRLSISLNNAPPITAALTAKGWLSAHINLTSDSGSSAFTGKAILNSIDESSEPNATHSTWQVGPVCEGDKIEIRVLSGEESDPPTEVTHTSDSSKNLFSNAEQARLLLSAVEVCDRELMGVLHRAKASEPKDEFERIALAVVGVVCELDRRLITPALRRHPELLEEAKQKKLVK